MGQLGRTGDGVPGEMGTEQSPLIEEQPPGGEALSRPLTEGLGSLLH